MNILYITHYTSLYGANRSLLDMIEALDRNVFQVYVILPSYGELERKLRALKATYAIIPFQTDIHEARQAFSQRVERFVENSNAVSMVRRYIHKWDIDIVHSNASVTDIGAIAALLERKKHIWHIRELPVQYRFSFDNRLLHRFLLGKAAKVICISKYVRKEQGKTIKKANTALVYNPIRVGAYKIQRGSYFNHKTIRFLVCGVIFENKKQLVAVEAIHSLLRKGISNISLTVVGDGDAGYRKRIVDYIQKNHLERHVEMLPFADDLCDCRMSADIAIMSSVHEALGRVTLESMLSELLVIGADSGATSELIKDGHNGLKYDPSSPEDLACKMEYAIHNMGASVKMIKNAKRFAAQEFDSKIQILKIEEIYKEACREGDK